MFIFFFFSILFYFLNNYIVLYLDLFNIILGICCIRVSTRVTPCAHRFPLLGLPLAPWYWIYSSLRVPSFFLSSLFSLPSLPPSPSPLSLLLIFNSSCLFIKTWALFMVYRSAEQLKKTKLTPIFIIARIALYVLVEIVFLVIWSAVDRPKVHYKSILSEIGRKERKEREEGEGEGDRGARSEEGGCQRVVLSSLLLLFLIIIIVLILFCFVLFCSACSSLYL